MRAQDVPNVFRLILTENGGLEKNVMQRVEPTPGSRRLPRRGPRLNGNSHYRTELKYCTNLSMCSSGSVDFRLVRLICVCVLLGLSPCNTLGRSTSGPPH